MILYSLVSGEPFEAHMVLVSLFLLSIILYFFLLFVHSCSFVFCYFPSVFLYVLSLLWCQVTNQYHGSQSSHCFQACDRSWICKLGVTLGYTHCIEVMKSLCKLWSRDHCSSCKSYCSCFLVLALSVFPSSWFLSQSLASTSRKRFKLVLAWSVMSMEISGSHESQFSNKGWTHERHQLSYCPS